jgi:(2Fe-2S) ferredoxin
VNRPERHFFVCGNRRPLESGLPSCSHGGAAEVSSALRRSRETLGLSARVFITDCGCLGVCPERGCTVVVYPDGVWYTGVTPEDVAEIVEHHMVGGEVVDRLVDRALD